MDPMADGLGAPGAPLLPWLSFFPLPLPPRPPMYGAGVLVWMPFPPPMVWMSGCPFDRLAT